MKHKAWLAGSAVTILIVLTLYVRHVPRSPFEHMANTEPAASPDGEYLARVADCVACHSTAQGEPFAGGLKMGTPMGVLYATNITPDSDTGIGRYTLAEFDNAVRRGVARDGHRLYPAMPYPSYAKLTDEDVRKLYGYFMLQVKPVLHASLPPDIGFPLNQRWGLALWNGLFVTDRPYEPRREYDDTWNRGAYLVQGLGHCGSCHTPRGWAFNEKALDERGNPYLDGARLDNWYASNLRGDPTLGLGRWTEQEIVQFLKDGHNPHVTVYGSMLDAFNNSTQFMTVADLTATARYLKSLPGNGGDPAFVYDGTATQALERGDLSATGAGLYVSQCSTCHGMDGKGRGDLLPPVAGNAAVLERDSASLLNIMLNGAGRIVAGGVPDSYRMTPFRVLLSDQQIADIATFIRTSWGNSAGAVLASEVRDVRLATDISSDEPIVLRMR